MSTPTIAERTLILAPRGRDAMVAKGILRDHLGIDAASLNAKVFPDAAGLKPAEGLLRA